MMRKQGEKIFKWILNQIWKGYQIPKKWKTAIIVSIHKRGHIMKCENYRGIFLLCVPAKLPEKIVYYT